MISKRFYLFVLTALLAVQAIGQENYVNVIPPSPAATAMQQYGNTNVSLYTGAVGVSIPIHTIKLRELEFPIGLNYSGSGGINVQQVASWVGIGWTLNATGAVSRTIYGLPDDKANAHYGYLSLPEIPIVAQQNVPVFRDFINGSKDAEPDKYLYNANGISGAFYINKQKQVIQVPITNNKIVPKFELNGIKIIGFDVVTDRGITYQFTEQEESRATTIGSNSNDLSFDVSSWYLTSIRHYNGTDVINFYYEPYSFTQLSEVVTSRITDNAGGIFQPRYVKTETHAKRLKYITYNESDTIEFITGSIPRRDLTGEQFLSSIEVKENDRVRATDFSYSYFDNNGVTSLTAGYTTTNAYISGETDGDHFKRLKLDAVHIFNEGKTEFFPYTFEYYTDTYLPSRFSYARDHWGFYNGQNNNTSLEPRYKVDLRPIPNGVRTSDFAIYGNANREPSVSHAKAGMLTKMTYPTGGSTSYSYELHQSSLKLLPNEKQVGNAALNNQQSSSATIHLEAINDPFVDVTISVVGTTLSSSCDVEVTFTNTQTGAIKTLANFNAQPLAAGKYSQSLFLVEGDYTVSFVGHNGAGNCFADLYSVTFRWENELPTPNKNVGGLRIKSTTDVSGLGESVTRVYNYVLENSTLSSGSLASVPRYGYYEVDVLNNLTTVLGWYRMYNTNVPLALTHGSQVGYKRVEVTTESPQKTGKTVYYYSCPADFPDFTRGWTFSKYDDQATVINGMPEYTYIFPQYDDRDWKRGYLYAQVEYKYKNGEFIRIASKESHYKIVAEVDGVFDFNWKNKHPMEFLEAEYNKDEFFVADNGNGNIPKLQGLRAQCNYAVDGNCGFMYLKNYELFSGRVQLESQIDKTYQGQNILTSGTTYFYDNQEFFYPTRSETLTSKLDVITTQLKYSFDHASLENLPSENNAALSALKNFNMVAEPVEKMTSRNGAEVDRQRTNYKANGTAIYRDNVGVSVYGESLVKVIDFIGYDAEGNLLEYKGRDGLFVAIKYGYDNQLPIAKVINAHYNEIFYESFEETGTVGNSRTGKKFHTGDYTVNLLTANANSILSYWYWENSSWRFKQIPYAGGSVTITDGERIDEVRVYPVGAQMTTYSYSPGIGFTSVTDSNNNISYYEYDTFGRLEIVKDHRGNILQQTKYHITNHPTYEP